jgi:hypothetical protein
LFKATAPTNAVVEVPRRRTQAVSRDVTGFNPPGVTVACRRALYETPLA